MRKGLGEREREERRGGGGEERGRESNGRRSEKSCGAKENR